MGLFRAYERSEKTERKRQSTVSQAPKPIPATSPDPAVPTTPKTKIRRGEKQGPTRTRREAEAERMERLHPTRTPKEQRRADREAKYKAQQEAWDRVENAPERTLLRDFVDTRWTVAEFLMPLMILIMAAMIVFMQNLVISFSISVGLWVVFIIAAINIWIMWRSFKKLLAERVPRANKKGLLMYMINRAMMIRRFRRPGPRIARGEAI